MPPIFIISGSYIAGFNAVAEEAAMEAYIPTMPAIEEEGLNLAAEAISDTIYNVILDSGIICCCSDLQK